MGLHDYLGRPLVLQLSPQLVQLTDAKGTPVGVASVQYIPGSGHPVVLSYHHRTGPQTAAAQPIASIQPGSTSPTSQQRIAHVIPIQQGVVTTQPQQTVIANVPPLTGQPRVVQATQVVQKQNDNTFRFAQMGSGGQFTVAPPTERSSTKGTPVVMKAAGTPHAIIASPKHSITSIIGLNQAPAQMATMATATTSQQPLIVAFQPTTTTTYQTSPPQANPQQNPPQTTVVQNGYAGESMNPCLQGSPRTADLAGDSPHMPNSGQSEAISETGDGTIDNPITFDDPSSILTPAALSMHEEMLRAQQKKVETLLEELAKSQAHLKQEQQLILTAKKAQQRLREQQRENATNREREQWLRELDVGHINKQHIQHFLQHKKQQAALQVSQANSPASAVQEPIETTYEIPPHNFEQQNQKPNIIEDDQQLQSVIICDASGMQLNHDQTVVYHQNGRIIQEGKPQTVDMEEIFKSVLEDASRAMGNSGAAVQNVDCTMTNNAQQSQQTMVVCQQQWQQPMQLSEMEIEGTIPQTSTQQPQQIITQNTMQTGVNVAQPAQMMMTNTQSYEQNPGQNGYSQDIDDLMAVLRDDQGNICSFLLIPNISFMAHGSKLQVVGYFADGGSKPGSFQMDLGVGYGSEELADLLGDDWLDCADRSIANNGQYAPYSSEPHDVNLFFNRLSRKKKSHFYIPHVEVITIRS
ncbi:hypothetical protein ANCCEY_00001 [Ancylostoma ceylanicum]|uniref:Uncharacterized protein n=1 Tax=Ancylostoma ceylanicum TaxID=53326 RepID=A0A0D6M9I3_9BILA|nr:hypothetical protein ANCCEY_00001 [Ancylostoma ceylanicum]